MGIISLFITFFILILSLFFFKKKATNPIVFFILVWTIILFFANLNLYNILPPSNEAYMLILIMILFFFFGGVFGKIIFLKKNKRISMKLHKYILNQNIFTILYYLLIFFTLIDFLIIIKNIMIGVPFSEMRRWGMGVLGVDDNPIISRRSFVEEMFRSVILSPFANLVHPICAYIYFNDDNKKNKRKFLIRSLLYLLLNTIAGGGGRLGFIFFIGCYLLSFLYLKKRKHLDIKIIKKYKKYMRIGIVFCIILVTILTGSRTTNTFFQQTYRYFAMAPTLLSIWLPIIKDNNHTYGLLTIFGIHSYIFRFFEKFGLSFLVPDIYYDTYQHILNAEKFKQIGGGVGNAFVSPIYYFYIDGGIVFICLASFIFGAIISDFFKKYENNINIKSFTKYCLIMYAIFISFMRVQTAIPSYIISFILLMFIMKKNKEEY